MMIDVCFIKFVNSNPSSHNEKSLPTVTHYEWIMRVYYDVICAVVKAAGLESPRSQV